MVHPTAIIDPAASVDPSAEIGPFAVIDAGVILGPNCWLGPQVHLTGNTRIGARNRFHAGCVIGDAPQDVKYAGAPTGVEIGDDNVFREHVTVHRSNRLDDITRIGSGNLLMAHCHVGHNSHLGNQIVIANGALLGGHVRVDDRVFISGNCLIHQFVRIGTLSLMQGGAGIGKDLPPFTMAWGVNALCGLNVIGMRRAGIPSEARLQLRAAYHQILSGAASPKRAAEEWNLQNASASLRQLVEFVKSSSRGVLVDRGRGRGAGPQLDN